MCEKTFPILRRTLIVSFLVQKDLDLGSVLILAPMGSSVHVGLKDELKKHFPNMMNVSYYYREVLNTGHFESIM